jgi:hypothetical protein
VASSSTNSTDVEPAPRRRATDAQRWAHLDELAEARRQLDEELANLHQELGEERGPRNLPPAPQQVPVRDQHREGNGERQERCPATE